MDISNFWDTANGLFFTILALAILFSFMNIYAWGLAHPSEFSTVTYPFLMILGQLSTLLCS
jgi:hypothetical protein